MSQPKNKLEKKSESIAYCWTIEAFPRDKVAKVKQMFTIELCGQLTTWSLSLRCDPETEELNDLFWITLTHHGKSLYQISSSLTSTLIKNNKPPIQEEKEVDYADIDGDWEFFTFVIETKKADSKDTLTYSLKLEVRIDYNVLENNSLWEYVVDPQPYADLESAMERNKENSDIEVITRTGSFHVTRCILTARSITLFSMYEYETCKDKEVLYVTDVDADLVREMLRYFYTGRVNDLDRIASDLLVLVDRFNIPLLKDMCEMSLVKQLNMKNTSKMSVLADRYQLKELQKQTVRLVTDSLLSDEFKKLLSESTVEKVSLDILNKMSQDSLKKLWCP